MEVVDSWLQVVKLWPGRHRSETSTVTEIMSDKILAAVVLVSFLAKSAFFASAHILSLISLFITFMLNFFRSLFN